MNIYSGRYAYRVPARSEYVFSLSYDLNLLWLVGGNPLDYLSIDFVRIRGRMELMLSSSLWSNEDNMLVLLIRLNERNFE